MLHPCLIPNSVSISVIKMPSDSTLSSNFDILRNPNQPPILFSYHEGQFFIFKKLYKGTVEIPLNLISENLKFHHLLGKYP